VLTVDGQEATNLFRMLCRSMSIDETAQKIRSMIPPTLPKLASGGRGAAMMPGKDNQASSTAVFDYSEGLKRDLY